MHGLAVGSWTSFERIKKRLYYSLCFIIVCVLLLQVLYALPQGGDVDDAVVSESGAMNVFFFMDKVGVLLLP
jgi:hypothetical protein